MSSCRSRCFVLPDDCRTIRAVRAALSIEDWQRRASFLNRIGSELQKRGLAIGYHNHNFDFVQHCREAGLDLLLRENQPCPR